jgi:CubicO group peptidase (beta-lactamase class C family)
VAADLPLPGVAAALLTPDGEPVVVCTGQADVASGREVTEGTAFRIGSISKTMTTLAVLAQVEAGRVQLDDAITDHVDARITQPRRARPITVRDLLTHRSGIGELPSWSALRSPLHAVGGARAGRPVPSLGQLAAAGYRAECAPGEKWVYANPAYTLLGLLVEELSDRTFAQVLADDVFGPTGMDHATLDPGAAPTLATGHAWSNETFTAVRPFEVSTVSAGGVICTLDDLVAYAQMLLDGGVGRRGRVISTELLHEAMRTQFQPHPALGGIGLTFRVRERHGVTTVGHTGGMPGWNAGLLLCPDRGVAAVALTNRAVAPSAEFGGGRLVKTMLDLALSHEPVPVAAAPPARSADAIDAYVGTYRPAPGPLTNVRAFTFFGGQVKVSRHGDHLHLRGRGGALGKGVELTGDPDDPLVFRFDHQGVRFALAFDESDDGSGHAADQPTVPPADISSPATWPLSTTPARPSTHVWMEGVPTAFSLHRARSSRRTRAGAGAALVAAAGVAAVVSWRRAAARRRSRRPTWP